MSREVIVRKVSEEKEKCIAGRIVAEESSQGATGALGHSQRSQENFEILQSDAILIPALCSIRAFHRVVQTKVEGIEHRDSAQGSTLTSCRVEPAQLAAGCNAHK